MKTSNKILLFGVATIIILFTSALIYQLSGYEDNAIKGNGKMTTITFKPQDFTSVKVSRFDCEFIPSENNRIEAKIDENLKDIIITDVKDGVLHIKLQPGSYSFTTRPQLKVHYKEMTNLSFSSCKCTGVFKNPNLDLDISAGGVASLQMEGKTATIDASSGSTAELKGNLESADLSGSSGAILQTQELIVANCNIKLSSGAMGHIFASNSLTGKVSSGGNLIYYGSPAKNKISSSSGGSVSAGE